MNVNPAIVWPAFGVLAVIFLLMNPKVRRWIGRLFVVEETPLVHGNVIQGGGSVGIQTSGAAGIEMAETDDDYEDFHGRMDSFRELHSHVKAHGDEEAQKALETLLPLITKDQPETNEG